ncbi:MAG: branched-chain amino acid ABC transporter permease, partial [Gammaproteobacteria bacterium]
TDESYAVASQRYQSPGPVANRHWYYLGSAVFMYGNWQLCTFIGIVTGTRFEALADWGLEFAMVVTFIGIVVPLLVTMPMMLCAVVAGTVSLALRDLPNQLGLMVGALAGMLVGLAARRLS